MQAWQSSDTPASPGAPPAHHDGVGDELTFGPGAGTNTSWDQFAANEQMFGVTTSFDEDLYTTKLDRSSADYKEKERKAQRIASEIMGVCPVLYGILGDVLMNLAECSQQSAYSGGEKPNRR